MCQDYKRVNETFWWTHFLKWNPETSVCLCACVCVRVCVWGREREFQGEYECYLITSFVLVLCTWKRCKTMLVRKRVCVIICVSMCVCVCLSGVCTTAVWQWSDISCSDILSQFISPASGWTGALEGHTGTSDANLSFCQHQWRALQYISHRHTHTNADIHKVFFFSPYSSFLMWNDTVTVKCRLSALICGYLLMDLMNGYELKLFPSTCTVYLISKESYSCFNVLPLHT